MDPAQEAVHVPRPRKLVTFGLIVLALFMPWLALYLDGASWPTIGCNFVAWFFLPLCGMLGATIHAIICLLRSTDHRKYSKPARRRLRYNNHYSAHAQVHMERKALEPNPEPEPVTRAITPPPPVERTPTDPPAAKSSAKSSTASVSSSNIEKQNPPADTTAKNRDEPSLDRDA